MLFPLEISHSPSAFLPLFLPRHAVLYPSLTHLQNINTSSARHRVRASSSDLPNLHFDQVSWHGGNYAKLLQKRWNPEWAPSRREGECGRDADGGVCHCPSCVSTEGRYDITTASLPDLSIWHLSAALNLFSVVQSCTHSSVPLPNQFYIMWTRAGC